MISHILAFAICCGFALTAWTVKYITKIQHRRSYNKLNADRGVHLDSNSKQSRLDLIHLILIMTIYSVCTTGLISLFMGNYIDPDVQRYTKNTKYLLGYLFSYFIIDREVIKDIFYVMIINTVLFIGKWYFHYKMDRCNKIKYDFKKSFTNLDKIKCIWVAPFQEEYVYRVLCLYIYEFQIDGANFNYLFNGLLFSQSHQVHYITLPELTPEQKHKGKIIQVFYYIVGFILSLKGMFKKAFAHLLITFIFGTYSGQVIVRTQSIWPTFLLHSYCNLIEGIEYFPDYDEFKNTNKNIHRLYIAGVIGWVTLVFYVNLI